MRKFEYKSRPRWLASVIILCTMLFLLTACGGQTGNSAQGGNTGTGNQNEHQGEKLVKHAMGETWVPEKPQRVVVLDTGELDNAIALGVTPVGAVSAFKDGGYLSYIDEATKNITNVGTIAQPNLETIYSLTPDLILSSKVRHENIYKQLSDIAPTVFTENVGVTWKENLKLQAEALGKSKEAEDLMQKYYARLEDFKQKMGDKLATTHVSIIRVLVDRVRIYQNEVFIGVLLKDAGLPRPEVQDKQAKFAEETTYENIKNMDGDVIFVMHYGNTQAKMDELTNQPQWKQLNAVKGGNVYTVSDDIWSLGIGIGAADKVIDDLYKYLVDGAK